MNNLSKSLRGILCFMFLFTCAQSFAISLSCQTAGSRSDGELVSPQGHNVGAGVFVGVSKFKAVCEDGFNIEADFLAGFMLTPFYHSSVYQLYCPFTEASELPGDYSGFKADLGILLLDFGVIALSGKNTCFVMGYGYGWGLNAQVGNFNITQDSKRKEAGKSYKNGKWEINNWSGKMCQKIDFVHNPNELSKSESYEVTPVRIFLGDSCPIKYFSLGTPVLEMARSTGITNLKSALDYNLIRKTPKLTAEEEAQLKAIALRDKGKVK